ncbi:2'-5' RNA ligase family protein [Marinicaulis aureus]|uniref:2'-5' RNA ligase family protein n=1 Tax=Hyphococcus aureus TaxID=2666033 RepID=A0ABW1KZI3_9PROT
MNRKSYNLFFAILPDQEPAGRLEMLARRLCSAHKLTGHPFEADRFHISLQNLGEYSCVPNEVVDAAGQAAASVNAETFKVTFDRAGSFDTKSGRFPLVLLGDYGLIALRDFHRQLVSALKKEGLGRFVDFNYTPHITLLYADRLIEDHPVEAISWQVKDFLLILSHIGESRYDFLGQWSLHDNAQ